MTEKPRDIYITQPDRDRLTEAVRVADAQGRRDDLRMLSSELERAHVVPSADIPADVVTMNSRVALLDMDTNEVSEISLVFPEEADFEAGAVSVLAPVGTAILGYRTGDVFEWKVPAGVRKLQIKDVLYQPEAAGDLDD